MTKNTPNARTGCKVTKNKDAKAAPALTDKETTALSTFLKRRQEAPPRPKLKVKNADPVDGVRSVSLEIDHGDPLVGWSLMTASLGAESARVTEVVVDQVCALVQTTAGIDGAAANRVLALVQEIAPQNTVEAMLAVQMAAIHMATIKQAQLLNGMTQDARLSVHADATSNSLNKLARTFTTQAETLKKLRSKGEQKVIVEHQHVHVYPGGQAVVGNVSQGGGEEIGGQPHERQLRLSERAAVLGTIEADQVSVQGTGREGLESLPVSRGPRRSALRAVE